jgi:hypothetical protein
MLLFNLVPKKQCSNCGLPRPVGFFTFLSTGRDGLHPECRICKAKYRQEYHVQNPTKSQQAWRVRKQQIAADPALKARRKQVKRDWEEANPRYKAKCLYGVDWDALWLAQDGKCKACGGPMLPQGNSRESAHVDHDHSCCPGSKSCGKCIRGMIHARCNHILGMANDDPRILRCLIYYLESFPKIEVNHEPEV